MSGSNPQFTNLFGLTLMPVGSAFRDQWGQVTNENLSKIDVGVGTIQTNLLASMAAITTNANGRLATTGGTLSGDLVINKNTPQLVLRTNAANQGRGLVGASSTGAPRFQITLGNATPEGGANAGSDFAIDRFSDAGSYIGSPLVVTRSTGMISVGNGMTVSGGVSVSGASVFNSGGVTVNNGALTLLTEGTAANHAVTKGYVDNRPTGTDRVLRTGDTMSGDLTVTRSGGGSPGTGVVFLGNSGQRYIFWDGGSYILPGGQISCNGLNTNTGPANVGNVTSSGFVIAAGNFLTDNGSVFASNFVLNDDGNTRDTGMYYGGVGGHINFNTNGNIRCQMRPNGDTQFWGNIFATGNFIIGSDERLKDEVETVPDALATIHKLRGVNYRLKDSGARSMGVIAQELEAVLPNLVTENGDGMKSVALMNLIGLLIEAIKELDNKVDDLGFEVA